MYESEIIVRYLNDNGLNAEADGENTFALIYNYTRPPTFFRVMNGMISCMSLSKMSLADPLSLVALLRVVKHCDDGRCADCPIGGPRESQLLTPEEYEWLQHACNADNCEKVCGKLGRLACAFK